MTTSLVRTVIVNNAEGVHLRPADLLVRCASQFTSEVLIGKGSEMVDCKSILSLMTLGADQGSELRLEAKGDDAQAALDALVELIESGFPLDVSTDGSTVAGEGRTG